MSAMSEAAKAEKREYYRQWSKNNRERCNEYQRNWRAKNREKAKKNNNQYWERLAAARKSGLD